MNFAGRARGRFGEAPDAALWAGFALYQVLLHLALPLLVAAALLRSRKEPLYRRHFAHRFGLGPVGPRGAVWIYATSLGETRAASPLIRALLDEGHAICLTHSSPAGLSDGRRLFDDPRITHRYVPLDLFWALGIFLWRLRPVTGLVVEHEIWPGQLMMARIAGCPTAQVNGNLTDRDRAAGARADGDAQADGARPGALRRFRLRFLTLHALIVTKTPAYRARYLRAGVRAERIVLAGELKFDQWIDPAQLASADRLRAAWTMDGAQRSPVLLIASSVEAEEEALLEIVLSLRARVPAPRIVWVPRSPQRFAAVARKLSDAGVVAARRTELLDTALEGPSPPEGAVLVGDSLGEMYFYCQLADLVFVGASLVPHGGHNIIEPLALGRPVVMGPSVYGITFPAIEAQAAGALRVSADAGALRADLNRLLGEPATLEGAAAAARGFSGRHTGAARRSMNALAPLLERRR
ncbi:3-deoxy-D-manno-octulosonic acid transferase [Profundibacterium mesophilum]|uniref:3-deoxy-D-manno-octulosonic acid transferase n=1 Tax=Profundibacterium mesophilum KAUST100406-0324 TaxID=1037889 RepID=A0A921NYG8_9RHOB|nr:glycosyltransferase N-terminal domain-containing protein [Profundibacterium mesophilum]KAF0677019.1 putative 3-deoxy-D-manno-octulosonic-acid transferase [Profundibacterium mesophilum KAUST100406-0324]